MAVKTIMVVGAGQMGSGIAQVAAQAGLKVYLRDVEQRFVDRGLGVIQRNLGRDVEKGRRTAEERDAMLNRITGTISLEPARECDMAIEAVVEDLAVKTAVFRELDQLLPAESILATNTSSLPITRLAAETKRADKVIGMHFMNPVRVMKLVEVIRGIATSDETYETVRSLAEQMGKVTAEVQDFPGFAVNRVLIPMINEAAFCVYEGIASVAELDTAMKLGTNQPMGPLTLADFIGLDTCLAVMEVLYEGFKDSKYRPCPLLVQMVQAGYLGRKSGKGFYTYLPDGSAVPMER